MISLLGSSIIQIDAKGCSESLQLQKRLSQDLDKLKENTIQIKLNVSNIENNGKNENNVIASIEHCCHVDTISVARVSAMSTSMLPFLLLPMLLVQVMDMDCASYSVGHICHKVITTPLNMALKFQAIFWHQGKLHMIENNHHYVVEYLVEENYYRLLMPPNATVIEFRDADTGEVIHVDRVSRISYHHHRKEVWLMVEGGGQVSKMVTLDLDTFKRKVVTDSRLWTFEEVIDGGNNHLQQNYYMREDGEQVIYARYDKDELRYMSASVKELSEALGKIIDEGQASAQVNIQDNVNITRLFTPFKNIQDASRGASFGMIIDSTLIVINHYLVKFQPLNSTSETKLSIAKNNFFQCPPLIDGNVDDVGGGGRRFKDNQIPFITAGGILGLILFAMLLPFLTRKVKEVKRKWESFKARKQAEVSLRSNSIRKKEKTTTTTNSNDKSEVGSKTKANTTTTAKDQSQVSSNISVNSTSTTSAISKDQSHVSLKTNDNTSTTASIISKDQSQVSSKIKVSPTTTFKDQSKVSPKTKVNPTTTTTTTTNVPKSPKMVGKTPEQLAKKNDIKTITKESRPTKAEDPVGKILKLLKDETKKT